MLNISEARAFNTLLHYLGIDTAWGGGPATPSAEQAMDAAAMLADRANRVLSAGVRADDVARCWPRLKAAITAAALTALNCEVCGRAKVKDAGGYFVCPDDSDDHAEREAAMYGATGHLDDADRHAGPVQLGLTAGDDDTSGDPAA